MDKQRTTRLGGIKYTGIPVVDGGGITISVLSTDTNGKYLRVSGTSVPLAGTAGYAVGCLFIKTNVTGRNAYLNQGTTTACDFALLAANTTSSSSSSSSSVSTSSSSSSSSSSS